MTKDNEASLAECAAEQQRRAQTQAASAGAASSGVAPLAPAPASLVCIQRAQTPRPPAGAEQPLAPQLFSGRL
eukprot:15114080-Alexandrium_andersonii.AAC.1